MKLYLSLFSILVSLANIQILCQTDDSLAMVVFQKHKLYKAPDSIRYYSNNALNICKNGSCSDSVIARLYYRTARIEKQVFGNLNNTLTHLDSAIWYFEQQEKIDNEDLSTMTYLKGKLSFQAGDFLNSIYYLKKSIALADSPDVDTNYFNKRYLSASIPLMLAHSGLGDSYMALKIGNELLDQHQVKSITYYKDAFQMCMGIAYSNAHLYSEANNAYMQIEPTAFPLTVKENIATSLIGLRKFTEAEALLNETEEIRRNLLLRKETEVKRYYGIYEPPQSTVHFENNQAYGETWLTLMELYTEQGCFVDAYYAYKKAMKHLTLSDPSQKRFKFTELFLNKAKLEYKLDNLDSTIHYLDLAIRPSAPYLFDGGNINSTLVIGGVTQILSILQFRAKVLHRKNLHEEALENIYAANRIITYLRRMHVNDGSRFFLLEELTPITELGLTIYQDLYQSTKKQEFLDSAYHFFLQNKGTLLQEQLELKRKLTEESFQDSPDLQRRESDLRRHILNLNSSLMIAHQKGQSTKKIKLEIFKAEKKYSDFLRMILHMYPKYYTPLNELGTDGTLTEILKRIRYNQLVVDYFMGKERMFVFGISKKKISFIVKEIKEVDTSIILEYHQLVQNNSSIACQEELCSISHQLYEFLLEPVLRALSKSITRITIIPDGNLHFVPFELLSYNSKCNFKTSEGRLLEKYAISYLVTSQQLLNKKIFSKAKEITFSGFGIEYDSTTLKYASANLNTDQNYELMSKNCAVNIADRELGKLHYSDDEVIRIGQMLDGNVWVNKQATKARFFEEAPKTEIIHLAMHGTYDKQNPLNSSLIFSINEGEVDSIFLRASEVYNLNLDGKMVVLSACNTGYGDLKASEGVLSLSRAFHFAGIPAVVGSLWSVPDHSTAEIMVLFYKNLIIGLSKDIALQRAKLEYLKRNDLSSPSTRLPFYWASMVVYGDTEPLYNTIDWNYNLFIFICLILILIYIRIYMKNSQGLF